MKNHICGFFNTDGEWQTKHEDIALVFEHYFSKLFKKTGGLEMNLVLDDMQPKVLPEMNAWLIRPYSREELEDTIKHMPPTKAPAVDEMPAIFYQQYWHVVGNDVVESCLEILNGGKSVEC